MIAKSILLVISVATLALAVSPVGSGTWTSVSPGFSLNQCEGGKVDGDTFVLPKSPDGDDSGTACSNGHLRAERWYQNKYSSGTHQFGGEFKITAMTGNKISLKQTFGENPYFLLGVQNNGDLYNVEGGAIIASGVAKVGSTVQINTVHDTSAKTYKVYVNGKESYSESAPGGTFFDKVGAYTSDSGSGGITVVWSSVSFWTQ